MLVLISAGLVLISSGLVLISAGLMLKPAGLALLGYDFLGWYFYLLDLH